jgi:hypothetical protein
MSDAGVDHEVARPFAAPMMTRTRPDGHALQGDLPRVLKREVSPHECLEDEGVARGKRGGLDHERNPEK